MEPVLDKTLAVEKAGGKPDLAKELFAMLLNELPELKNLMNMAYQANDPQGFWDHTHKIYGSTAYCGVPALRNSAKALENAIKAEKSFLEMGTELKAVNQSIEALIATGKNELHTEWPE